MKAFAYTDIGRVRDMNQDSYYISSEEDEIKLFIVADGMGGYKGGEVASRLAIEGAKHYIYKNYNNTKKEKEDLLDLVKKAVEFANTVVYDKSQQDKDLDGMGTTIDVCLVYGARVYIGHVGDSRVYRQRKDFFRKLTTDHSYVEQLIREGNITREEAYNHPKKNMLTRALGCTAYVEPDVSVKGFSRGDILLICTDGLTNMLRDPEISNIIKNDPENACKTLVEYANDRGGIDNITAVIIL